MVFCTFRSAFNDWCKSSLIASLIVAALLTGRVHAGFDNPAIELLENGLEGISIEGTDTISIRENVGKQFEAGFAMVKFRLTDPNDQIEKLRGDARFEAVQIKDEWFLNVSSYLDYESLSQETFELAFLSRGDSVGSLGLIIKVEDENDNAPRLLGINPDPLAPIDELKKTDAVIFVVSAIDDDKADTVLFSLQEDDEPSDYFRIDVQGEVFMEKQLNYSEKTSHRLYIILKDDREPFHETKVGVTVFVQDIPNLPPEFTRPPIIRSINEHTEIGTPITTVQARDGDYGLNFAIEYSIEDDMELLDIDPKTGLITVKNEIDAESPEFKGTDLTHTISVIAKEKEDPNYPDLPEELTTTKQDVTFSVVDINDQLPVLCSDDEEDSCKESDEFSFEINEDQTGQVPLQKTFRVKDFDSTTSYNTFTLKYADVTSDIIKNAFTISPIRGTSDETFYLTVSNQNTKWIDVENEELEGFWGIEQPFTIEIIGTNISSHKAYANFRAKVKDINDNSPEFKPPNGLAQYEFYVCENTDDGTVLKNVEPGSEYPDSCPLEESPDWSDIVVFANDRDVDPSFGKESVIYRWSTSTRLPPIQVGLKDGSMTMNKGDGSGFDYERSQSEIFILEAVDSEGKEEGLVTSIPVAFKILDKNDVVVDLQFKNGTRTSIKENTTMAEDEFVLNRILATDVDTRADVNISMSVNNAYSKRWNSLQYRAIELYDSLEEDMKRWFKLVYEPGSTDKSKEARIVLGDILPDREGNSNGDVIVDRVDLIITATDLNSETGPQTVSQVVTIIIDDINDNPPRWVDDEDKLGNVSVVETEEWGQEGDTSSPYQREIYTFRATDPDTGTVFSFSIDNPDCEFGETVCKQLRDMFELTNTNDKSGTAILRRAQGKLIDREFPYISDYGDKIDLTIVVGDGNPDHSLVSKMQINVEDRNDNTPMFKFPYNENTYFVDEDETKEKIIETIVATDEDHPAKFGNVSYLLMEDESSNGIGKFNISLVTGELTAVPGQYDWFEISQFRLVVKAVDYYRSSAESGSNYRTINIDIQVRDKNTYAPEFRTEQGGLDNPLVEINERDADPDAPFENGIRIQDKDNPAEPNGRFSVEIESVTKEPIFADDPEELKDLFRVGNSRETGERNEKEFFIFPTRNLTGLWGTYKIELIAYDGADSDPSPKNSRATYIIKILNENLRAPEFIYPEDNSTSVYISIIDASPGERLIDIKDNAQTPVRDVYAEDRDKGSGGNGVVTYSLESYDESKDCVDLFTISERTGPNENITGMITLKESLKNEHANKRCELLIKASDRGDPPQVSHSVIEFRLLLNENTPPAFPFSNNHVTIYENTTDSYVEFQHATDEDIESQNPLLPQDQIYYMLKGGDSGVFELSVRDEEDKAGRPIRIPRLTPKGILDREEIDEYKISIYATNRENENVEDVDPDNVDPTNKQWIVVTIEVLDVKDTAPEFTTKGVITGGFSQIKKTGDNISTIVAYDPDLDDPVSFQITSNFTPSDPSLPIMNNPFELIHDSSQHNTVQVVLRFDPQPSYKGFYTFQITATDTIGYQAVADCQMYMVTDKNILKFFFINDLEFVKSHQDSSQITMLSQILSSTFSYRCNIDRVIEDAAVAGTTVVETHFIDLEKRSPILADSIIQQQYNPNLYGNLTRKLSENNLTLARNGIGGPSEEPKDDNSQIITYVLIGGVAVLAVTLLVLGTSCYYNNRSLSRRIRAITATTFGSQNSDLNRAGALDVAPNTNTFAIEGSNPIWTVDEDKRKIPEFDTDSVGSGGSVLIGAEDEDYFQKSSKNPMFQADDVVANYDSDNDVSDHRSYGGKHNPDYNTDYDDRSYNNGDRMENPEPDTSESPFATRTTKNPLLIIGDTNQISVEDDNEGFDEAYDFEGNTDSTLF